MLYINTNSMEYPLTEAEVRSKFPNTSFPSNFTPPEPYAMVEDSLQPVYDRSTQKLTEITPVESNGKWVRAWEVTALSEETISLKSEFAKAELIQLLTDHVQAKLDNFARERNYDNILSTCTYATSSVEKYRQEGQYCIQARDTTWAKFSEILEAVEKGVRDLPPGLSELDAELPVLTWPQ